MSRSGYAPTAETKRRTAVIEEAALILNCAADYDHSDMSQEAMIGRAQLNHFALNLDRKVRDNLVPQYDEAIVEMTRWLEGDEATIEEQLALQD